MLLREPSFIFDTNDYSRKQTPPGLLREPGSARNFGSERVPPGLPRESGSTHDPNRQEDLSRTSTETGL